MIVVDASVWVSRLVAPDVHHAASRQWLAERTAAGELIVAPALLLAEVAGAIARRTDAPELAQRAVDDILRVPRLRVVPVDRSLGSAAARLAASLRLRGADAVYVAVADRLGIPLVTWDREQLERATTLIPVREPVPGSTFLV